MEYQKQAWSTALPKAKCRDYITLGLVAEVGELCGKLAKQIRDGTLDAAALKAEVGDCQWFLAAFCTLYGWDLGNIAQQNIEKLKSRLVRGRLTGDGDQR